VGSYILADDILHSDRRENLKSDIALTGWAVYRRCNVSPVMFEQSYYISEDDILLMKNVVFWDVTPCGVSEKLRASIIRVTRIVELRTFAVTRNRCTLRSNFFAASNILM
jgi:hypothetical protein